MELSGENNIYRQQQYEEYNATTQLPEGWRKVYITKETQWDRQTVHKTNNTGQIPMVRMKAKMHIGKPGSIQTEDSNNVTPRKLWHHDHIFWLITFCLNIYDFYWLVGFQCCWETLCSWRGTGLNILDMGYI